MDYLEIKELYHSGVKGMKWGVRKEYEELGYKKTKPLTQEEAYQESKKNNKQQTDQNKKEESKDKKNNVVIAPVVVSKKSELTEKYFNENGDPKDWREGETREEALERAKENYNKDRKKKIAITVSIGAAAIAAAIGLTYAQTKYHDAKNYHLDRKERGYQGSGKRKGMSDLEAYNYGKKKIKDLSTQEKLSIRGESGARTINAIFHNRGRLDFSYIHRSTPK